MSEYAVQLRAGRVVLPPVGGSENFAEVSIWDDSLDQATAFSSQFYPNRRSRKWVRTTAVLAHHGHNTYSRNAISLSTPAGDGRSIEKRHLGYLYDHFLARVGMTNLPVLIGFAGGEVECTVVLQGPDDMAVDLPKPAVLGEAIRTFLAGHGIEAAGAPRREYAPRQRHTHARNNPATTQTLRDLGVYESDGLPAAGLRVVTQRYGGVEDRSLRLNDTDTGRWLGSLDGAWLFLVDERDRPTVVALLHHQGFSVNQPVTNPKVRDDGTWPPHLPPNVHFRPRGNGWLLEVNTPNHHDEAFATYNPALDALWVEDSRLVTPALVAMHRQGIDVAEVGLPRRTWGLDDEMSSRDLYGPSTRPSDDAQTHTGYGVPLLQSVRTLIPSDALGDTVDWVTGIKTPPDPGTSFELLEAHVQQRSTWFPIHTLTSGRGRCRLCGDFAAQFTTPICTEPLTYCHRCMETAAIGLVRERAPAAIALAELSRLEFDGQPMLADQLESLHVNPHEPVDASSIDRLLLLRFAIVRKRVAWTLLLEAAGFADDGLRTSRGTLIRARDGHLCHSLRERAVCDFLHQHGIAHDREPLYPLDPDFNRDGLRRADWLLADGTLVELWGMPNDPQYARKMVEKRELATRHGLQLVEIVDKDLPDLPTVFDKWLPTTPTTQWTWSPLLVATPRTVTPTTKPASGDNRGRNDFNAQAHQERLERCAHAVDLQSQNLTRGQICDRMGISINTVKMLLRDGKFYADPITDPPRADRARRAADARVKRLTRTQFQATTGLTALKAQEAWRDAAALHESLPDDGTTPARSGSSNGPGFSG